jgi:chromosome partitioning protein
MKALAESCIAFYNRNMKVVAIANQKGGVGKTALTANLASVIARRGVRVLAIDADPQAALTRQVVRGEFPLGLADVLDGNQDFSEVIVSVGEASLSVVPASRALADVETGLVTAIRREERLARALVGLDGFDLVLIDCPPNLGTITVNALAACDEVLVPVSAEDEGAVRGVGELLLTLAEVYGDQDAPAVTTAITKWDKRRETAAAVAQALPEYEGIRVAHTKIPSTATHHKAPIWGEPVASRKPDSKVGVAYEELARELALDTVVQ